VLPPGYPGAAFNLLARFRCFRKSPTENGTATLLQFLIAEGDRICLPEEICLSTIVRIQIAMVEGHKFEWC
jgi:hypothetical protein